LGAGRSPASLHPSRSHSRIFVAPRPAEPYARQRGKPQSSDLFCLRTISAPTNDERMRSLVSPNARGPVSRVLSSALLRLCGHSSRRQVTLPLKQPTRATSRNRPICRPYSVLHPVGFSVPVTLPPPRCALAAPFRPYPPKGRRYPFCGTFPESSRRPTRRALPGTVVPWSPDFPRPACAGRGRPALWRGAI
jgi:hypothetical protein